MISPARWDLPTLSALLSTCPFLSTLYSKKSLTLTPREFGVEILTIGIPVAETSSLVLFFEFGSNTSDEAKILVVNKTSKNIAINFLFNFFNILPSFY